MILYLNMNSWWRLTWWALGKCSYSTPSTMSQGALLWPCLGGSRPRMRVTPLFQAPWGPLVPAPQLFRHCCPPPSSASTTLSPQWRSPYDLRAWWRESAAPLSSLLSPPGLFVQSTGRVGAGGLELGLHAVVTLLVTLQAAHHNGVGAAFNVKRVLLDAVLRGGLALAVEVDSMVSPSHSTSTWTSNGAILSCQVWHGARVRRTQVTCRPGDWKKYNKYINFTIPLFIYLYRIHTARKRVVYAHYLCLCLCLCLALEGESSPRVE